MPSQIIKSVTDASLPTSDITTNNASTTKHGFAPKYPNDATKYLDGTGAYSVPAGGAAHGVYTSASPPTTDVGLFVVAKTGVDAKTAATTDIFTVPTGRAFLCTGAHMLVTAVTSGGAGTEQFLIQESSANRTLMPGAANASTTPVANQTVYWADNRGTFGNAIYSTCAAGNKVQIAVSISQAGSSAVTATVFVEGFYTQ